MLTPFDPSGTGGLSIPFEEYLNHRIRLDYSSNFRKPFNYEFQVQYGDHYNGNRFQAQAEINYRLQPWAKLTLAATRNEIRLPEPYSSGYHTLVGPKLEVSWNKQVFSTLFIQYNTRTDNLNFNARIQYRYLPLSDIFVVYTRNNDITDAFVTDEAFVLKMVYWLNPF